MSSPPAAPAGVEPPSASASAQSSPASVNSLLGVTRTRDEFDADSGDDTSVESPHPKLARTDQPDASTASSSAQKSPSSGNDKPNEVSDPTAIALCEELECGMCAGVFIDPVALNGCGHVFCGSCVQQWIKSIPRYPISLLPGDPVPEPIACPHCRHTPIQTATPSRIAKTMVNLLLSRMPNMARPPNEHRQAQDMYTSAVGILKFPIPPPPPRAPLISEFWRPCRSCYPSEEGSWRCPTPVARFDVPAERDLCVRADGIPPDGHRLCAGCDRLSPCQGPRSANCGICGEGFCGEMISGCECVAISQSKPTPQFNHFANVLADCPSDMLALAFKDNWNEMSYLSNYIAENETTRDAAQIYKDIIAWLRTPAAAESGGVVGMMNRADINLRIRTGMADELQKAIMPCAEGTPEAKICGGCVDEILCAGIFEWWMRELKKPEVANSRPANQKDRPNCKFGRKCTRQDNHRHGRKFNHICEALPADEAMKIHQDDTMPTNTAAANDDNDEDASSSDSDDDEDKEEVKQYLDAAAQPAAGAVPGEATIVIPTLAPIRSVWLAPGIEPATTSQPASQPGSLASQPVSQPAATPVVVDTPPGPSVPALPIASIVNPEPIPPNLSNRRVQTPPPHFPGNTSMPVSALAGSADSELAVSTAMKLSLPVSPTPPKTLSYPALDDPNMMLAGPSVFRHEAMDVDL